MYAEIDDGRLRLCESMSDMKSTAGDTTAFFRTFTQTSPDSRHSDAYVEIGYWDTDSPWLLGEAVPVSVVYSDGVVYEYDCEVIAQENVETGSGQMIELAGSWVEQRTQDEGTLSTYTGETR